jgi:hypothetical protein
MKNKLQIVEAIAVLECAMIEASTDDDTWRTLWRASQYLKKQAGINDAQYKMIVAASGQAWNVGRQQERVS